MLFRVAVDLALPKDAQTYAFSEVCFCSRSVVPHRRVAFISRVLLVWADVYLGFADVFQATMAAR